jgi:hypothetical protein
MSGRTDRVSEKSLIEDIAENIERLFREMWPYQDQQSPMKVSENEKITAITRDLSITPEELEKLPAEEQSRIAGVREREKKAQEEIEKARLKVREINEKITHELSRLTEETYPRHDPKTPERMYDFLLRFSRVYTRKGKQRSAGPILEYLYTACDHAYWLWKEWIAACIAVGDTTSAERLLAVLIDGNASSSQAHRFNAEGGMFKSFVVVTKGMIALKRDGDLQLACKYAETARNFFAESPEAINFYHAINQVKEEVESGRLKLSHIAAGRGRRIKELLDAIIPPVALITGNWKSED